MNSRRKKNQQSTYYILEYTKYCVFFITLSSRTFETSLVILGATFAVFCVIIQGRHPEVVAAFWLVWHPEPQ